MFSRCCFLRTLLANICVFWGSPLGFLRNLPFVEQCHFRGIRAENHVRFSEESHWTSSEMEVAKSKHVPHGFPMNLFRNNNVFRWICIVTTMFSDEFVSWQPCFPMNLLLWQPCFPMNLFRNNQVFWWICLVTTILIKLYRHNVFRWFVVTRKRWLLRTFCNWGFLL